VRVPLKEFGRGLVRFRALNRKSTHCPICQRWVAGRIVNIAAAVAGHAAAGMGPYTASKAGVERLTEALAAELGGRGIAVNAVLPGVIDTLQNRASMPDADIKRWVDRRPLRM
jgi:NAD(P)-dependent dehydrogenase (short-subunit alcohol dehydrogenase family)